VPHDVEMRLTRCLVVAAAYIALLGPASSRSLKLLPLSVAQSTTLLQILRWMLGLLLAREFHNVLNEWAENNWLFWSDESTWDWKSEVAVVTGGSSGIGAMVVKKLISYGVRVAVLDVEPLSAVFQQRVSSCPLSISRSWADLPCRRKASDQSVPVRHHFAPRGARRR